MADGVQVIDRASQQQVEVSSNEAQRAYLAGEAAMPAGEVQVVRGTETGTVDATELGVALAEGWQVASAGETAQAKLRAEANEASSLAAGAVESGLAGLSFGLSTKLEQALGVDMQRAQARRDALGGAGTAIEVGAGLAAGLATGGAGLAARGGVGAARGLAGATGRALAAPTRVVSRLGAAVEGGAARAAQGLGLGARGTRVLAQTARGAAEGYVAGVGSAIDENALGDRELVAEQLFGADVAAAMLLGAGLGGAMPMAGEAAYGLAKVPTKAVQRVLGRASGAPGGEASEVLAKAVGADDVPWLASAAEKLAPLQGADPETARRLFTVVAREPKRLDDVLNRKAAIEEEVATALRDDLRQVRRTMDEARLLSQGESKYRNLKSRLPRNADTVSPRVTEDFRSGLEAQVGDMMQANEKHFGRAYDVSSVREAERLVKRAFEEAAEDGTAAGSFRAMDRFKKDLGLLIEETGGHGKPKPGLSTDVYAANKVFKSMYKDTRKHLERGDLWGGAADIQRQLNASYAESAAAAAFFRGEAAGSGLSKILAREEGPTARQALALARQFGRMGGPETVNALDDALEAQLKHLRSIEEHYTLDVDTLRSFEESRRAVRGFRDRLQAQAEDAALLDDFESMRGAEGMGSVSIGSFTTLGPSLAGVVGGAAAGPMGAAAGAIAGSVMRPATTARTLAAIGVRAEKLGWRWKGAAERFRRRMRPREAVPKGALESDAEPRRREQAKVPSERAAVVPQAGARVLMSQRERERRAAQARERALDLAGSPERLSQALGHHLQVVDAVAPGLSGQLHKLSARAVHYLNKTAPPVYHGAFGGKPLVDPVEAASYAVRVDTLVDPGEAAERLADGEVSPERVETLREVYPVLWHRLQDVVLDELMQAAANGTQIPHELRTILSLQLGLQLDPALQPAALAQLQEQPAPTQQQSRPRPQGDGRAAQALAAQKKTGTERLATGRQA